MSDKFTLFGFIKRAAETQAVSAANPITWDDVRGVSEDDVKKYYYITGARNPKSDMDRWKTVAAMRGLKNLSNKSFTKWKNSANSVTAPKNQSTGFSVTPEELKAVTKPRMDAYAKVTGAQDLNSELDRWKTIVAEKGNANLSNKDFNRWKKDNNSTFSVAPYKYNAKVQNTQPTNTNVDPLDDVVTKSTAGDLVNSIYNPTLLEPWYDKLPAEASTPSPATKPKEEPKSVTGKDARLWRSNDPASYYSRSEIRRKIDDMIYEYEGAMLHPREYYSQKQKYDLQQRIIEMYNGIVNQGIVDRSTLDSFDALMAKYDKYLDIKDKVIYESLDEAEKAIMSGKRSVFD